MAHAKRRAGAENRPLSMRTCSRLLACMAIAGRVHHLCPPFGMQDADFRGARIESFLPSEEQAPRRWGAGSTRTNTIALTRFDSLIAAQQMQTQRLASWRPAHHPQH